MESTIPDPRTELPTPPPAADRAGRIEAHGIDHIPDSERHGRPRDLFAVWAAPNVSYLNLVVGGTLVLIGLDLWQSLAVIVVGNLLWAGVGLLAVSGPAAGAPSEVIMRAMFGVRGNRVNIAVTGWLVSVCYLALNWAAASLAAFGLAERAGLTPGAPLKVLVIVLIAAATLAISVYGHATIVRLYGPFTLVLTAVFLLLTGYLLTGGHTDWHYRPADPLHGTALVAALAGGTALIASAPLSYSTSADFSRYLPRTTSPRAVAGWTALGAFVPSVLFTALGSLAATTLDMTDPQSALTAVLPGWFRPLFLLAIVLSAVANNAMTAYSSGLALQAVGLRIRRSRSVALDGALGVALTLYALLVSNFLDTVNNMLELMVALTGPVMAVYATDVLWRRNRYHGPALTDETPGSPHWYFHGVNRAGAAALVLGTAAATLCLSTQLFTGPLAHLAGDTDLSLPAGMLTAAATYWLLMPRRGTA
ncbi:purine-cytosine permease family protein [Kitasatospora cheerisanensis]|uniref:Nitrate reductase n=1 Tax=Kitasatospora cheerisanensis KCTC 2395 TaxID=1348663 RepID=A0A066Z2D9_9ACTN|nr:cytosine permease [Kitasatospora cheerisanensis]KDN86409.1 nitrate reductase [Kitasatospora cheerisanensis KCTC 2395]